LGKRLLAAPCSIDELAWTHFPRLLAGDVGKDSEAKVMNRIGIVSWALRAALALLVGVLFVGATPLRAQVDEGTILGTVRDSSGATINGATVTLTNEGTGASLTFTTGDDGGYRFTPIKIGSYKVSAVGPGFATLTQTKITVDVGANVVIDFALKPGQTTVVVEVTAEQPVLETQSSSVGQVVDQRSVNDLPLNGRNFTFLAQLGAGVNTPQADTRGNAASGAFTANGQQPSLNNYLLDGIDNNSNTVDFLNGTNYVVLPPVDAISEFKVQTTDFSAEFGRSGAAVLNATTKSGTNEFHGALWEFFRNDKLDAANFFENQQGIAKGDLQQNQFGFTAGGPVVIPHVFNGRNKVFFFGDYEGLRRVQGETSTGSVPTVADRNSWNAASATSPINLQDLITQQTGTILESECTVNVGAGGACPTGDQLSIPNGTILDPATTHTVTAGQLDPVTGLYATTTGAVREPFGTCAPATVTYTLAGCGLNVIPFNRVDPNAIKLLNLFPLPTTGGIVSNYGSSPKGFEHANSFDTRLDINFNDKNQLFFRFSLKDDPQFIPGVFGGIADGGAFQQGNQTANAQQSVLGYTHTFSPTLINEIRAGLNYLKTTRSAPEANTLGIPAQFGIEDIPQVPLNGGLPAFTIEGLSTLGSNNFLPSDEISSTIQLTDDVTKIYGKHAFKMGFEYQHVKFSTLQPSWSHGQFDYNGDFVGVAGATNNSNTGLASLLLTPIADTAGDPTYNYLGGTDDIRESNIGETDDGKNYYGGFFLDDWKVTPKLTLNLGLRYDFFGQVFEHHSAQANFDPDGPGGVPTEIFPLGNPALSQLSPSFLSLLSQDGIALLETNKYGGGLGYSQKDNFAPRVGFAYQVTPKLVVRGGFGIFYDAFENRGYSPNLGESYPFQFSFNFPSQGLLPLTFPAAAGCTTVNGTATFETGFSCAPLQPSAVIATGLALPGIQVDYKTPYSMGGNLTIQYQITPSLTFQAGYVTSQGRHIETLPNSNNVSSIAYYQENTNNLVPFPDFGQGASYVATDGNSSYNGLQTQFEKRFSNGLNFLATYTYSQVRTDARDALNQGSSLTSYRGPDVPGFGIHADYQLAPEDIRNVVHLSGGYQLPFGKGKHFLGGASGLENAVVGGWSINWSSTLEGGQPVTISCPQTTAAGLGCGALFVKGQSVKIGLHDIPSPTPTDPTNSLLGLYSNGSAAFNQPCVIGTNGQPEANLPIGCVPLAGTAALGGIVQLDGPTFKRVDFSTFKDFALSERFKLQFRAEFFNIANHPNFNAPNFGGNGVVAISGSGTYTNPDFGAIGSTRDGAYDSREIQFALKLYY
jgi:Carboxypeptidase regulatory-like domain/TonB dependent receptor